MNEQKILDALRFVGRNLRRVVRELETPIEERMRKSLHERMTEVLRRTDDALDEFVEHSANTPVMQSLRQDDFGWYFIANSQYPKNEGEYECFDKHGRIGKNLYGNSGAPNEPTSFFDSPLIKARDIIAWRNVA